MRKRRREENELTIVEQNRRRKNELKAENAKLKEEINILEKRKKEKEEKMAALGKEVKEAIKDEQVMLIVSRTKEQRMAEREAIEEQV